VTGGAVLAATVHGVLLGVGLIAALGPQNVFVFQQGAVQPRLRRALPTVATAGLADTGLVALAVLGVSVVVLRVPWVETALFGVGTAFLVVVGYSFLRWPALAVDPGTEAHLGVREQVAFTAGVSLLNPHAVLDTVGVIGTSALAYDGRARLAFAAATIAVSWTWFGGLATAGRILGDADDAERYLGRLNAAAALVVWAVAAYTGWRFLATLGAV